MRFECTQCGQWCIGGASSEVILGTNEAEVIRLLLEAPQKLLACPRCSDPLTSDLPLPGADGSGAVYLLRCAECRRYIVFDDLGRRAAPHRRSTL